MDNIKASGGCWAEQQQLAAGRHREEEGKPSGFERKPQLDEHRSSSPPSGGDGLRGSDKRQGSLQDAAPRGMSADRTSGEQRTPSEDAQPGADVRAPFAQDPDRLPDGVRRERKHPLQPAEGRGGKMPDHVPSAPPASRIKP